MISSISCHKNETSYDLVFVKDSTVIKDCNCDARFMYNLFDFETVTAFKTDSSFWRQDEINAFIYNKERNSFILVKKRFNMIGYGRICNSDEIVEFFDLNSNQTMKIKFNGKEFEPCVPKPSTTNSFADILITELYILR